MTGPRKICVVTGGRADFGLLTPIMHLLNQTKGWNLSVIGVGMHFLESQGSTFSHIAAEGFPLDAEVRLTLTSTSPSAVAADFGLATASFGRELEALAPDGLLVLGDRYEILAAVFAAYLQQIPVFHLHGGELTGGLIDEGIRHAITKFSSLHLVAADKYRQRVIQMGEQPESVVYVGASAAETIFRYLESDQLTAPENNLRDKPALVLTYHPVSMQDDYGCLGLKNLLQCIDEIEIEKIAISSSNLDPGGHQVASIIADYIAGARTSVKYISALGHLGYLQEISSCTAIVGNSSSGLIEASILGIPTLDVGSRQMGRIKPANVISVTDDIDSIRQGLKIVLSHDHIEVARKKLHPFGGSGTSSRVLTALDDFFRLGRHGQKHKVFYDLNASYTK